jgi:anti-sigma B factor antagonist
LDLSIEELDGRITCVRLHGRLDAPGADVVGSRFTGAIAPKAQDAVVDLSGVTFIASMGLRLLISTARALDLKGARLVLFGANAMVQDVLDDAAIDQIIPVARTERDALAKLQA